MSNKQEVSPERQAYVTEAMYRLGNHVHYLSEEFVDHLEERATMVLRPQANEGKNVARENTGVLLADELHHLADRLEYAIERLNDILGRIEL